MSPRDALLPVDPSTLPEAVREPIEGVSFTAYLLVEAARLDGIADRSVLSWLGVRETSFARAEERWSDLLSDELAREGGLFDEVYEDLVGRALSLWARAVDPLDHDVEAWMAYQRLALLAESPDEVAKKVGLTRGDEIRLARLWRRRLAESADLAAIAAAAWSGRASPLPKITLSPLVFPPAREPA